MTVREVIEALSKLSPHLPVAVVTHIEGDGLDDCGYTEVREISEVTWEGRFVALDAEGGFLP